MAKAFKALRNPALTFDDILGFGRHQGYKVGEILKDRPEYIAWLIDNTSIKFTKEVNDVVNVLCPFVEDAFANMVKTTLLQHQLDDGVWDDDIPF